MSEEPRSLDDETGVHARTDHAVVGPLRSGAFVRVAHTV
jgi:hypothetical protein